MSETKKVEKGCRIYVNVPFRNEDMAKKLMLKYDYDEELWYFSVRNRRDVKQLDQLYFLLDHWCAKGFGISDEKVDKILKKYIKLSNKLLEDNEYHDVKFRLCLHDPSIKFCADCYRIKDKDADVVNGLCKKCRIKK